MVFKDLEGLTKALIASALPQVGNLVNACPLNTAILCIQHINCLPVGSALETIAHVECV